MMGDDGNSLQVSAYTCNYDTWNVISQDVPAPNLRDEGTPRHATSGARIKFIWLHQNMGAKRPSFLYKNDYAGREAPRYSNKKQDPQREAL